MERKPLAKELIQQKMAMPYHETAYRPPGERIHDFEEVRVPFTEEQAVYEASRCIQCKEISKCMAACPAHNNIPLAMKYISEGEFIMAAEVFRKTSSFPEICGRICPQEQLCEGACNLNRKGKPVHIGALESFVSDYAIRHQPNLTQYIPNKGKRVAVIGGGPSGLACAEELRMRGHQVTIYDSKPLPGGLLVYGIPTFKLSTEIFFAKMMRLINMGVRFNNNVTIGKDIQFKDLIEKQNFDAVYIAIGAGRDATMNVPGEELEGVYHATEFLVGANVHPYFLTPGKFERPNVGKHIVVIGGGDTASDCLRTALRLGSKSVTCLYRRTEQEMPGCKKDRELAKEEWAQFRFLTQPVRFHGNSEGHLEKVECVRTELGEPDDNGRRKPVIIEDSNFFIQADTAVLALGYWPDPIIRETEKNIATEKWGLVLTDKESGATSMKGVFSGGDAVNGPELVVTAMADGRRVAGHMHQYLESLG